MSAISDPDSPVVQDALTRRCLICKAEPGQLCTPSPIPNCGELPGRIVHFARTYNVEGKR